MTDASKAAPKGFTGKEAIERLAEKAGKVQVQMTALSLMAKMKGQTNKTIRLRLGDKCPSWISKIFTIADKVLASAISSAEKQAEISGMTVAAAEAEVTRLIEAHMTALGVGGSFEKYGKVCHFAADCEAVKALLNPKAQEDAQAEDKPVEPVQPVAPVAPAENTAIDEPIVGVDLIVRQAEGLADDELLELANRINALMMARAEMAALVAATEERKAA